MDRSAIKSGGFGVNILAIDGSGKELSLCLRSKGQEIGTYLEPMTQIEQLPRIVAEFCRQHGLEAGDIQALSLIRGPGSYAGLRGSLLLARSLALLKAVPVMTRLRPEVLLFAHRKLGRPLLIAQSVRLEEFFAAVGSFDQGLIYLEAPRLVQAVELTQWQKKYLCPVIGDWHDGDKRLDTIENMPSIASALAEWTELDFQPEPVDNLIPFYVRPAVKPAP